jgi:ligand-binding SRPBCC domain-containing protein
MIHTFQSELWVPRPLSHVFEFFSRAENLEAITPPFLKFRITKAPEEMKKGALIEYALKVHGLPMRWKTEIESWEPPHKFVDVQLSGPYKLWHHTHRFSERNGGTMIEDHVNFELPFGPIGDLVYHLQVKRDVEQIFAYRTEQVMKLL